MSKLILKLYVLSILLLQLIPGQSQRLVKREAAGMLTDAGYLRLYWSNYDINAIEQINLDGTNRHSFVTNVASSSSPGSFAMEVDVPHQKRYISTTRAVMPSNGRILTGQAGKLLHSVPGSAT
jgi:hypothetical protein